MLSTLSRCQLSFSFSSISIRLDVSLWVLGDHVDTECLAFSRI
jgi:hypothetical protein